MKMETMESLPTTMSETCAKIDRSVEAEREISDAAQFEINSTNALLLLYLLGLLYGGHNRQFPM